MKDIITKKCPRCGEIKNKTSFYVNSGRTDNLAVYCKLCESNYQKTLLDKKKEYNKKSYYDNHENRLKAGRDYYNRTIERQHARHKNYHKRNPDIARQNSRNRRAKIRGAEGAFSEKEWQELLILYGNKCLCCGESERLTRDHVIPISRNGKNTIENIQPLCIKCNDSKGVKSTDYRGNYDISIKTANHF